MTTIAKNSALAAKVYSVACFAETQRKPGFAKNMTGPAPKQPDAMKKLRGQTSPDYPFVRVNDLSKTAGERVSVDLFNVTSGKPVMGDKKIAGKLMKLKSSSMDIYINQYRAGVDPGGEMTQQRTLHNLREVAKAQLAGYASRLEDQLSLVHVAGARGSQNTADWAVPLASDPDFAEIMVNDIKAPTYNRRLFASNATSLADLDVNDKLLLSDLDRIRTLIDEMAFPLQGIKLEGDVQADERPLYVLYVTPQQWYHMRTAASAGNDWRTFLASAHERVSGWKGHPLFTGSPGMWAGILVKQLGRSIRFAANEVVKQNDVNNAEQDVTCAVATDRAILMGAQALGCVYGRHQKSDYYMSWHEETTDHGNVTEISVAMMGGKAKLRFVDPDGNLTDHGVITIDSYSPAV